MKRITYLMLGYIIILFLAFGIKTNESFAKTSENEDIFMKILATDRIQYEMVKEIVGNKHNIQYMCKDENQIINSECAIDISSYSPDIIFYSSRYSESLVVEEINDIDKSKTNVIDLSRGCREIKYKLESRLINPYYWNGKDGYIISLYNIKSALQEKDPLNRDYYEEQYEKAVKVIDKKIETIKESYSDLNDYIFISIDDYLDYFYKDLDLHIYKVDKNNIGAYLKEKNIDKRKVIILKDRNTEYYSKEYKLIDLERYNANDPLMRNYKIMQSI